jgi:hypothetical protein
LAHITFAYDLSSLFLGLPKRRQQQGGKDSDDGNDYQQLDQCESAAMSHMLERS